MTASWKRWKFVDGNEFRQHASGLVQTIRDLYEPSIFGAAENFRCACGAISGTNAVGNFCRQCRVLVTAEASLDRRRKLGVVPLSCLVPHPFAPSTLVDDFPVAPIAYRINADGSPNLLGQKYERLVSARDALQRELPTYPSEEYFRKFRQLDISPIVDALRGLVFGDGNTIDRVDLRAMDSLASLLVNALLRLDPEISPLLQSMGCELELHGRF
jgi:hypothetical protein